MNMHFAGLWRNPAFMKLWFGQTVSEFGSRVTRDAIPLVAVITLSATPAQLGLLTAIPSLPILLFGLYIGVWVDRLPRLPMMFATNVLRFLILLVIPAAALAGLLSIEILYAVAAAMSVLGMTFEIAYRAVLPSLVSRDDLVEGNTKLALTDSLAEIGGPALAGLLVQGITAPFALLFDAVSYLVAALSLRAIGAREETVPVNEESDPDTLHSLFDGWRFLLSDAVLRPLLFYRGTASFFGSFIGPLYALYAIETLKLSPGQLGLVIASGGVGAVLGAALSARLPSIGKHMIPILLLNGAMVLLIPLAHGSPLQAMLLLITSQIVGDASAVTFWIHELSLRQSRTPDALLGRVNASSEFLVQGVAPLGAIVAGFLAALSDPRTVLFLAAAGIGLSVLWVVLSPLGIFNQPTKTQAE
jgi:MFS family permease